MSSLRRKREDMSFSRLPTEIFFKISSYLDLPSIRSSRATCKTWKYLIDSARVCNFVCELTDATLSTVTNSEIPFPTVRIYDFTGVSNKVMSWTRGPGRIISNAESIVLSGTNIESIEIEKMAKYTTGSLRELSFERCRRSTLKALLYFEKPFEFLQKLSLSYKSFPSRRDTRVLQTLAASYNPNMLPVLRHLKLSFELDHIEELYIDAYIPSPDDVFTNYLAISRVIARHRASLKHVEILRNEVLRTSLVLQVDTTLLVLNPAQRRLIEECMQAFEQVQLDGLHITPLLEEGTFPWTLETSLMKRQEQLKEISFDKKLCFPRQNVPILSILLPNNVELFTSVKVGMTCLDTNPVDLTLFSRCPNLQTLWLTFFRGVRIGPAHENSLHFTNLESLPRSISSLHLKASQTDIIIIHQQSILSRGQVRWIIDNLRNLKSLWLQLVAEENEEPVLAIDVYEGADGEDNANPPPQANEAPQMPNAGVDINNNAAVQQVLMEELNANANFNTQTFRDLISMPKLRDMKFDMLKAGQVGAMFEIGEDGNPWILPVRPVSRDEIREYVDICNQTEEISSVVETESAFFPFRFIELSISKR